MMYTSLFSFLTEAGYVHFKYTKAEFQEVASEWFRQAKQRDHRNKNKAANRG